MHCNRQLGSVTSPAYLPKTAASNATPLRCKQQTRCKRLHRKLPARSLRISMSSESDIEFARSLRSTAARSQRSSTHARAHLPELRHHTDADVSETSGGDVESDTALRQSSAHALPSTTMTPHYGIRIFCAIDIAYSRDKSDVTFGQQADDVTVTVNRRRVVLCVYSLL